MVAVKQHIDSQDVPAILKQLAAAHNAAVGEEHTVAVADLPTPSDTNAGTMLYCPDGDAGDPCLVVSTGDEGDWLVVALGAAAAVE